MGQTDDWKDPGREDRRKGELFPNTMLEGFRTHPHTRIPLHMHSGGVFPLFSCTNTHNPSSRIQMAPIATRHFFLGLKCQPNVPDTKILLFANWKLLPFNEFH